MVKPLQNSPFQQRLQDDLQPEWRASPSHVPYSAALAEMDTRVAAISAGEARECVWLLEHPPLYTAGTSARDADLLDAGRFPVYRAGRGGQYTYHGPGQRIAYVMLDLKRRRPDIRAFVCAMEDWVIATLADFGVTGERRAGRVGVWVPRPEQGPGREDKIAAIGVRVRRWVSFHGMAINVAPDLEHFSGIVPCGVHDHGVTSLKDMGIDAGMDDVDGVLRGTFDETLGRLGR